MNSAAQPQPAKVLTIGGSDSGGAAGIQADLKTWTALGVYGMSVLTAVTAQNSVRVTAVHYVSADLLSAQIDAVLSDYGAGAIKTGFIGSSELIAVISAVLQAYKPAHLVIDPVLVNHQSVPMFPESVAAAYRTQLLPFAGLITPNWAEAVLLAGLPPSAPSSTENVNKAITLLHALGAPNVLITGIRQDDFILDIFSDGPYVHEMAAEWIETENRHGSGDTLSAAICAYLVQGDTMFEAIRKAQKFTAAALQKARNWHLGQGHGPLAHFSLSN